RKQTALCYEKITNTRKDYLHKISRNYKRKPSDSFGKLTDKKMVKNHNLANLSGCIMV
ncbi:hypothetical protein HMPREF9970_1337, partial [Lachnoanaerobaculum saburreum F0468]